MSRIPSTSPATPDVSDFICFSVYALSNAFDRAYKPILDQLQLTYPQYLVLVALWKADDQTLDQLTEKLSLESSAVTPLLGSLEELGWIAQAHASADDTTRVHLTQEGKSLQAKTRDFPECIDRATGLGTADLARLKRELTAVRRSLLASPVVC